MRKQGTATLGDVIIAAFDEAARLAVSKEEVSRLATRTVQAFVRRRLPASWWSQRWPPARSDQAELAEWENEGGAVTKGRHEAAGRRASKAAPLGPRFGGTE